MLCAYDMTLLFTKETLTSSLSSFFSFCNNLGASTKKDTLHLNMNKRMPAYSADGITDCDGPEVDPDSPFESDLSDQPCRLVQARKKPGFIRIGGGETFEISYLNVEAYNEKNGYKHHLLGGAFLPKTTCSV